MEFSINGEGRSTAPCDIAANDAVWRAGLMPLHQVDADSVVIRLHPDLVDQQIHPLPGVRAAQIAITRPTGTAQTSRRRAAAAVIRSPMTAKGPLLRE